MRRRLLTISCFTMLAAAPALGDPVPADGIPAWALEEMEAMVGRWVADNSAYHSADEPFDAYGLEWEWGLGRKSLKGRLFGLRDGEEAGTFWEFRQFWHAGEQRLMAYQFGGDGTVGIGTHERTGPHVTRTLQTFYAPDGATYRVGHVTEVKDGAQHGRSYDVGADDVWTERRYYVWHREG